MQLTGIFEIHKDQEPSGLRSWNSVTNQGLQALGANYFGAQLSGISNWDISLITAVGLTSLSDSDTRQSHPGWSEYTSCQAADAGTAANKAKWTPVSTGAGVLTGASYSEFTITAGTDSVVGAALSSEGVLWCTTLFPNSIAVQPNEHLKVNFTVRATR